MPVAIDVVFVVWLLAASVYDHMYSWPRFHADLASGRPGARVRGYRRGIVGQWLGALGVLAIGLATPVPGPRSV